MTSHITTADRGKVTSRDVGTRSRRSSPSRLAEAVLAQLVVQRRATDAERTRGLAAIATRGRERVDQELALERIDAVAQPTALAAVGDARHLGARQRCKRVEVELAAVGE